MIHKSIKKTLIISFFIHLKKLRKIERNRWSQCKPYIIQYICNTVSSSNTFHFLYNIIITIISFIFYPIYIFMKLFSFFCSSTNNIVFSNKIIQSFVLPCLLLFSYVFLAFFFFI